MKMPKISLQIVCYKIQEIKGKMENWKPSCKEWMSESCSVMRDPKDCTVYGIFQGRILEWVAIPFSRVSS